MKVKIIASGGSLLVVTPPNERFALRAAQMGGTREGQEGIAWRIPVKQLPQVVAACLVIFGEANVRELWADFEVEAAEQLDRQMDAIKIIKDLFSRLMLPVKRND